MNFRFLHAIDSIFLFGIIFGLGLLYYLFTILNDNKWYKSLIFLRIIILVNLFFLLLNPVIIFNSKKDKNLEWAIFLDNSASIKNHKTPSINAIKSGLNEIRNRFLDEEIPFQFFLFDQKIKKINSKIIESIDGSGVTTNIGNLSREIEKKSQDFAGAIIFSDGIITEGSNPNEELKKINIPIHTVGIGEKSGLVDVSIESIDVPTVVLKNKAFNVRTIIQSVGNIEERLSVSIYYEKKLLSSKYIRLLGKGSKKDINFRFEPEKIGQQNYEVRISSIKDEINIINNRQNFKVLVLKDKYKAALITGSPNKNTSNIKKILKNNQRIELEHFVRMNEVNFKPEIKFFWSTSYDLIIFDNFPIKPLSENFIRILGKKILSQKSAIMLIVGPNQRNNSLDGITTILGIAITDTLNNSEPLFWNFINSDFSHQLDLPPLIQKYNFVGKGSLSDSLAIFDSGSPLWLKNQIGETRSVILNAVDIHSLYYSKIEDSKNNILSKILDQSTGWLLKSDGGNEKYFRLNKNLYQQGEVIYITGTQPFNNSNDNLSISIQINNGISNLISKDITFNIESNRWEGEFRAPSKGEYNFKIFLNYSDKPIQNGKFEVVESQVELSKVFLNEKLLKFISKESNGVYYNWNQREDLFNSISKEVKSEIKANYIRFNQNKFFLSFIILLFIAEWISRRRKGLS
ncbi:MAG: hypothetical protein ACJZ1P_01585 [Candidatus Neomarinimicrobiota bacterium]